MGDLNFVFEHGGPRMPPTEALERMQGCTIVDAMIGLQQALLDREASTISSGPSLVHAGHESGALRGQVVGENEPP
jgi:hypothetical protein